jgi:hypothetical protein
MMSGCRFHLLLRVAAMLLLLAGTAQAAQPDPPERVGRLNAIEGTVSFAPAGDNEWTDAQPNRPLTRGDRLWTDRATRADLQIGSAAIRLSGQTRLDIQMLDDQSTQLSVTQGSVYVRVRNLPETENFEIDTPNLAYRAVYPGDYRIDVDANQGTTRVTIHSGNGAVFGESGQSVSLGGGQQITFRGRALAQVASQESPPQDAFDRWAAERNRGEDQSIAARYVPREVVGYQQLDPYGQWRRNETYGAIWFPQSMPANWAPYRQGHWEWVGPWGWTWIDDAPWGFAPFHYGRWALVDDQWAWVPGRLTVRPVYAPALVAFVGGSTSDATWFPLAPGEAWRPAYPASALYVANINRDMPVLAPTRYAHERSSQALTAIALADFNRGRPSSSGWLRIATNMLTSPPIVPPPAMPSPVIAAAHEVKAARSAPAAAAPVRQGVAQPTPAVAAAPAPAKQPVADASRAAAPAAQIAGPIVANPAGPTQAPAATAAGTPKSAAAIAAAPRKEPAVAAARNAAPQLATTVKPAPTGTTPKQAPLVAAAPVRASRAREEALLRAKAANERRAAELHAREQQARRAERVAREQAAARVALAQRRQFARQQAETARRSAQARREERSLAHARRTDQLQRQAQARRDDQLRREARAKANEQARREAKARADEELRRDMHAAHMAQAKRVADREAQGLREQRAQREQQLQRVTQEREQAQRAASERDQQALTEQWRRDRQAWEQRQRQRSRPDLRQDGTARPPEVWQRGIPILNYGPTS